MPEIGVLFGDACFLQHERLDGIASLFVDVDHFFQLK